MFLSVNVKNDILILICAWIFSKSSYSATWRKFQVVFKSSDFFVFTKNIIIFRRVVKLIKERIALFASFR